MESVYSVVKRLKSSGTYYLTAAQDKVNYYLFRNEYLLVFTQSVPVNNRKHGRVQLLSSSLFLVVAVAELKIR